MFQATSPILKDHIPSKVYKLIPNYLQKDPYQLNSADCRLSSQVARFPVQSDTLARWKANTFIVGAINKVLEGYGISPLNIELMLRSNPGYPQQRRTTVPTLCIDVDASNVVQTKRWPGALEDLVDLLEKDFEEVDIEIVGRSFRIRQCQSRVFAFSRREFLRDDFKDH